MDYVRFRAEYGGSDYVATDVYKVEPVKQTEGDPAFATLRIWYSDPDVDEEDFEILEESFIQEACTVPSYPDRDQFTVKLAKSYSEEDVSEAESFQGIEYCRRCYSMMGSRFQLSLLGEGIRHTLTELDGEMRDTQNTFTNMNEGIEYKEIVELQVE